MFICAAIAPAGPAAAQTPLPLSPAPITGTVTYTNSGVVNGGNGPGYFVTGAGTSVTINGGTLQNFTTMGGQGSGGGAGLGGAIFIDNGAAVVLNGVNLSHNTVIGGVGGTVSPVGGTLNNGVVNGYFSPSGAGTAGATPSYFQDDKYLFGNAQGSGVNGGSGFRGTNATLGFGGNGGTGQFGTPGWGSNPVAQDKVDEAYNEWTRSVVEAAVAAGEVTEDIAEQIAAYTKAGEAAAGFNAGGPTTQVLISGEIAEAVAWVAKWATALTAQGNADAGVVAAQSALNNANAALSSWNTAANNGSISFGGNGGNGGGGGNGSAGFGGGAGGNGVVGGAAGNAGALEGNSGNGGAGGAGGFGGGGGAGGFGAGASGDPNAGNAGIGGAGGAAGFGGGVGSTGGVLGGQTANCAIVDEQTASCPDVAGPSGTPSYGGGGGSGYGGAIFVNSAGALTITGTSTFIGNNAIGGASLNGGVAGGAAGTDLFMMSGATVQLAPGAGNVITFNGSIADDSSSSIGSSSAALAAGYPIGAGASLTTYTGLTVFNGQNTYSGQTFINGGALGGPINTASNLAGTPDYTTTDGALQAANGVGLPISSGLNFNGPSQFTGGVLQTSGTFTRWVNSLPNPYGANNPGFVQWTGSGGFAAINAPLTVTLSNGGPLAWGMNGFVPYGSSLIFGSANSDNAVSFTNPIDISGGSLAAGTAASFLVGNNGNAAGSTATMAGVISGSGDLSVGGGGFNGTLNLAAVNTYTGATAINSGTLALTSTGSIPNSAVALNGGTLDISQATSAAAIATLSGAGNVALGSKMLVVTNGSTTFSGTIADGGIGGGIGGMFAITGGTQTLSGTNTYTGATITNPGATLALTGLGSIANSAVLSNNGTFDISATTSGAAITTLSGSGSVVLGNQFLTLTAAAAGPNGTNAAGIFSGSISGLGGLAIAGGHEVLTGTNTYSGGTLLYPNAWLTTSNTNAILPGSAIILVSSGGDLTSLFTGSMHVVGPLDVIDTQPVAQLTIGAGDILKGVGSVNANIVIQAGGVIAPGDGPGTVVISAPVAYNSGSTYSVAIDGPATSIGCPDPSGCAGTYSSTIVTGVGNTFTAGGTIAPTLRGIGAPANNNYTPPVTTSFTVVAASGGVLGSFAALTQPATGLAPGTRFDALYTPNEITLYVTPADYQNLSTWNTSLSGNQNQVAGALNALRGVAGLRNNAEATADFGALFQQQPQNLPAVFDTLSGEVSTGAQQGAFEMMGQFLGLMLDPSATGRNGNFGGEIGGVLGFASADPEQMPTKASSAYDSLLRPSSTFNQRWNGWASGFGAYNKTNGDTTGGSHDLTSQDYGVAGGLDYHFTPDTIAGFALAGGGTSWSLTNGLGTGRSEAFQAGVYAKSHVGPAYVAVALAASNHWMSTDRNAFAGDHLTATFNAQTYGGRIEGGYRYAMRGVAVTPYAAVQEQVFHTPNYGETDVSGSGFGLNYNAATNYDTRGELGARFDGITAVNELPVIWRARAAWAHDWVSDPALNATFQAALLPGAMPGAGASFTVTGASPARDAALVSAGAELRVTPKLSFGASFDGEFTNGAQTYAGKATVRTSW